jgi:hypothetical protein
MVRLVGMMWKTVGNSLRRSSFEFGREIYGATKVQCLRGFEHFWLKVVEKKSLQGLRVMFRFDITNFVSEGH